MNTRQERITALRQWLAKFHQIERAYDTLRKTFRAEPESPIVLALFEPFDAYTNVLSAAIGDTTGMLTWFLWDNDAGRRGLEAIAPGWTKAKPVKTVADLERFISACSDEDARRSKINVDGDGKIQTT